MTLLMEGVLAVQAGSQPLLLARTAHAPWSRRTSSRPSPNAGKDSKADAKKAA